MSKPKLTPWFPGHIKPVRPGVYETEKAGEFQCWCGGYWGMVEETPQLADLKKDRMSIYQAPNWRGLAEQPK